MNRTPPSARPFLGNDLLRLPLSAMLISVVTLASCAKAHVSPSIQRAEYVAANGTKLYLLIRGADRTAPVLLWLHGGPGAAERPLFRYFNGDLEKHFVVVYWDQRGAGRSFDAKADPHSLTIAQHLTDLDVVVNHLRQSLGQDKVILIGHSWGAALGLLCAHAYPDKVAAFIAVNPLVSTRESQQAQYDFVLAQATQRHDGKTLAQLREIGTPPYQKASQVLAMEKVAQRYGAIFHTKPNRIGVMFGGIFSGLVTPWEIPRLIHANEVSLEAMNEELLGLDLRRSVPSLDVPILFFLGQYDRHTDARIAAAYLDNLHTPVKRLVWFDKSAHNVPFEEPALFNATVMRELQGIGIQAPNDKPASLRAPVAPTTTTIKYDVRPARNQARCHWWQPFQLHCFSRRARYLDGYGTVQARVAGAIHFPHPARSERRVDFVGGQVSCRTLGPLVARDIAANKGSFNESGDTGCIVDKPGVTAVS